MSQSGHDWSKKAQQNCTIDSDEDVDRVEQMIKKSGKFSTKKNLQRYVKNGFFLQAALITTTPSPSVWAKRAIGELVKFR